MTNTFSGAGRAPRQRKRVLSPVRSSSEMPHEVTVNRPYNVNKRAISNPFFPEGKRHDAQILLKLDDRLYESSIHLPLLLSLPLCVNTMLKIW